MIYSLQHFLHVLGALGMAAALAVEATGLVGLRRSQTSDEARAFFRTRRWVLRIGPLSIALILATGIYASIVGWGWAGWIRAAFGGLLLIAVIGGALTGVPMARLASGLENAPGALPDPWRRAVRSPVLVISMTTRASLIVGIVLLMVYKPGLAASLIAICVAAGLGAGLGLILGRQQDQERSAPAAL
jgi:hypothetical protein